MLKSCQYCGKIHAASFDCGRRRKYGTQRGSETQRFHHSTMWTKKSIEIRERDKYLCLYCRYVLNVLNSENIEVHHIIPLDEDIYKGFDDSNLISLCRTHHEQAEKKQIGSKVLAELVLKSENEHALNFRGGGIPPRANFLRTSIPQRPTPHL